MVYKALALPSSEKKARMKLGKLLLAVLWHRVMCSKSYNSVRVSVQGIHQCTTVMFHHFSIFTPEESVAESQGGATFGGRLGVPKK